MNFLIFRSCLVQYSIDRTVKPVLLRWLDGVFQSQYLPSLSINYVVINKDLKIYHHGCIR